MLTSVSAKPGFSVALSYIFKDSLGAPIESLFSVTVSIVDSSNAFIEANLPTVQEGAKHTLAYTVPTTLPLSTYLVEFKGVFAGEILLGYLLLEVVLTTDADMANLSNRTLVSESNDGVSLSYDSTSERLKALQFLSGVKVGRTTKNRNASPLFEENKDYKR